MGLNRNRWTREQMKLLEELAEQRVPHERMASLVGHPVLSCRSKISELRAARREAEANRLLHTARLLDKAAALVKAAPAPQPVVLPDRPHARRTSTARLVVDAELRARIETLGATGGLLGDPLPGRSALDQRRAGRVDQPVPTDRRFADFRPGVTLATRLLR